MVAAWILVVFILGWYSFIWKSPILVCIPSLLLGVMFADNASAGPIGKDLVIFLWLAMFFVCLIYLRRSGVMISNFSANENFRMRSRGLERLTILSLAIFYVAAVYFWLDQSTVSDFSSSKRTSIAGLYYNVANQILRMFAIFAIIHVVFCSFSWHRLRSQLAVIVLIGILVIAFVSSSRATIIAPMLVLFTLLSARVRSTRHLFGFGIFGAVLLFAVVFFSASVAEHRANKVGDGQGWALLAEQISSENGNGFSPDKDVVVLDYVFRNGPRLEPVQLLGGFYGLIPRFLWPGKPQFVFTGPISGALIFRGGWRSKSVAGIPISIASEFAFAFGYLSFFLGIFLCGVIICLLGTMCKTYPLLLVPYMFILPTLIAGGLPMAQFTFITGSALTFFALLISGTKINYAKS